MKARLFVLMAVVMMFALACSSPNPGPQSIPTKAQQAGIPQVCAQAKAKGGQPVRVQLLSSIYVGWMPDQYMFETGILKKWGDQCNVAFSFAMATDYNASIEAYVAGKADGVTMTNMDALNMAAAAGVDSTAVVNGDTSHGNDAVISRTASDLCSLKGKKVFLVELSVSHYLLARGLQERCGMRESDLTLVNMSDSDIAPAYLSKKDMETVVTWNPIVLQILSQDPSAKSIFDSSKIKGEIIDTFYVRTELLKAHPEVGVALAGAWYEVMGIMTARDANRDRALTAMAQASGDTLDGYKKQLETTNMLWKPADGVDFTKSPELVRTMDLVRAFSFEHGLLGQGVTSPDQIGIQFSDGTVKGDVKNVKLRFPTQYMDAVK